jgi:hypothetical protein
LYQYQPSCAIFRLSNPNGKLDDFVEREHNQPCYFHSTVLPENEIEMMVNCF